MTSPRLDNVTTWARLVSLLSYDEVAGVFTWRISRGKCRAGAVAGFIDKDGYRKIRIDRRTHAAHRLAWFYVHKKWPKELIDHENHNRASIKIADLREASFADNNRNRSVSTNNKSGHKGVSWCKKFQKWYACIRLNGRNKNLGLFDSLESAASAYRRAADAQYGQFSNY